MQVLHFLLALGLASMLPYYGLAFITGAHCLARLGQNTLGSYFWPSFPSLQFFFMLLAPIIGSPFRLNPGLALAFWLDGWPLLPWFTLAPLV
jgi:hypothetical protein